MRESIKSCPWCPSSDLVLKTQKSCFRVVCVNCQAEGPTSGDIDDAHKYWNRRATPSDPDEIALMRNEILIYTREIERLTTCLKAANEGMERFERLWYLTGDALEKIRDLCQQTCLTFEDQSFQATSIAAEALKGLE